MTFHHVKFMVYRKLPPRITLRPDNSHPENSHLEQFTPHPNNFLESFALETTFVTFLEKLFHLVIKSLWNKRRNILMTSIFRVVVKNPCPKWFIKLEVLEFKSQ